MVAYGNELDRDPNNFYNWLGFGVSLALSVTPATNLGKIPLKFISKSDKIVYGVLTRFTSQGIELSFDMLLESGDKLFPIRLQ